MERTRNLVDVKKDDGFAAIHLAALLISHGANISNTDEYGDTALHIAISKIKRQSTTTVALTLDNFRDNPILTSVNI